MAVQTASAEDLLLKDLARKIAREAESLGCVVIVGENPGQYSSCVSPGGKLPTHEIVIGFLRAHRDAKATKYRGVVNFTVNEETASITLSLVD